MINLVSTAARGAQILVLGLLAALGLAIVRAWPRLAEVGVPAFAKIGVMAVPALVLLILLQKRRSRLIAALIVYAAAAALIYRTDWFFALIGI